MDVKICLPALYPLRYLVDHLEYRSLSTQSASLQAIKFFYEFWFIKHGTTFCYSFYCSGHDPAIAIHEMAAFFQYLENGRLVSFAPRALPFKHSSGMTNAARVRAVIRFIGYLISTYISPYYRNPILRQYIENDALDVRSFYSILFGLKILCSEEFPGFSLEDYEDLEFIPRPNAYNWEIYQDIDNLLDPVEKSMISKGLFEMATALARGKCYAIRELKHAVVLGLSYVTGARPVQLAKLAVKDFRIDTCNTDTGLIRYSILLPYVKQRRLTTERLLLAIPPEIGALIKHYVDRVQLLSDDKLLEMGVSAPAFVSQAISQTVLNFSPSDYQTAVACGEAALPSITPTDLRHNVGHSLAMQGASAEEIAHILGHSSLVVAKHYILATPALALIRAKALGFNPVWQNMVAMMLTGKLVRSEEWQGRRVVGMVGDRLHYEIGGCARTDDECPFCEVRCCYGCLYYRPFLDGYHQDVLDSISKEVDELIAVSDSVGNAHNPLISIHETTQIEVKSVIARCHLHHTKGCEQ